MTPQELKAIRLRLQLTQIDLAHWINPGAKNKGRDVRRWEQMERTIPGYIETLMLIFDTGVKPIHVRKIKVKKGD